jgi:preprotein translocase subunit SecD
MNQAKQVIRNTAQLEIKLVEGEAGDEASLLSSHGGKVPDDMEILPGSSGVKGDSSKSFYLVRKIAAVTGRDLKNASPTLDENNLPAVKFTLNSDGVAKFTRITGENIGRQLASS